MDILSSFLLGVIEGLTEFLPISSTGHLILASDFLGIEHTEFVTTFEVVIQSGAILAVIALFWRKIINDTTLVRHVLVAFIPTAIIGYLAYDFIKQNLLGNPQVVLTALFTGGVALIILEIFLKNAPVKKEDAKLSISYEKALAIGVFQAISMIPGVSRAAATIFGGMIVGLSRKTAVEFSFLLAIPTMFAATALDLHETSVNFTTAEWIYILIGFVTSFLVAIVAIKWLIKYVENHNFIAFGVYRIILSILYFLFIFN